MSTGALISDVNWIMSEKPQGKFKCQAKFRYRQPDNPVVIEFIDDTTIKVEFEKPVKAVTPGYKWQFFI